VTKSGQADTDVVVVGAGVVGLAIAASMAKHGREVYVLGKPESTALRAR